MAKKKHRSPNHSVRKPPTTPVERRRRVRKKSMASADGRASNASDGWKMNLELNVFDSRVPRRVLDKAAHLGPIGVMLEKEISKEWQIILKYCWAGGSIYLKKECLALSKSGNFQNPGGLGYGDVSLTRRVKHRLAWRVSVQSVWAAECQEQGDILHVCSGKLGVWLWNQKHSAFPVKLKTSWLCQSRPSFISWMMS